MQNETVPPPRRYRWPWFVLGAVLLGAALTVLWVSAEVRRTQARRQYYLPTSETNAAAPKP